MASAEPRTAGPFLTGIDFGEGPRWHDGRLWYSDFYHHAVYSVSESGDDRRVEVEVPEQPSGLGWMPDGTLLVVSMKDRKVLRQLSDGSLTEHADLRPWATWHGNDMVVAENGTAYVGNFGFNLEALFAGGPDAPPISTTSIVRIDPSGVASEAAADMAFPNGTVIFPGGKLLVVGESFGTRMTAFDINDDGTLTNRRVWAQLELVAPDGCCLDAEGCIWVANALGSECVRVAEGGEVVDRVATSQNSFACMLGGADRRTLYCITGPSSNPSDVAGLGLGKIEQARVDVPGAGLP
jgi:sugar lactone lactonase YvrE